VNNNKPGEFVSSSGNFFDLASYFLAAVRARRHIQAAPAVIQAWLNDLRTVRGGVLKDRFRLIFGGILLLLSRHALPGSADAGSGTQ
jgi:hypothetical protein